MIAFRSPFSSPDSVLLDKWGPSKGLGGSDSAALGSSQRLSIRTPIMPVPAANAAENWTLSKRPRSSETAAREEGAPRAAEYERRSAAKAAARLSDEIARASLETGTQRRLRSFYEQRAREERNGKY